MEYDGSVMKNQYSMLQMRSYGSGEHDFFHIFSAAHQIFHRIAMGYPNDILFDDRPLIQIFRDVMAGGSDDLNPSFISGMIWACSGEGR